MELLTQDGELIDYKGEPIVILPIESTEINGGFGLFCEGILLGQFEFVNDAIAEVNFIQDSYMWPYQVGTCQEFEDEEEFTDWLYGEYEDDSDESEDY